MTISAAADTLRRTFAPVLRRDVEVRVAGQRFHVKMRDIGFAFYPTGTARRANAAALAAVPAADGTVPAVDVPLATSVRPARLAATVRAIDRASTRAPREPTVRITLRHLRVVPGRDGASLSARRLAARIAAVVADPRAVRVLRATRQPVHPRTKPSSLKRGRFGTVITVDRAHFRLRLFKRLKYARSYPVAVGQPAYPTPTGLFSIANKAVNPTWSVPDSPWAGALRNESVPGGSADNPLKARWMGIFAGAGIHGTDAIGSIGSAASHGCIRMRIPDVIELYDQVPVGAPVYIA
jgi:lipoprotein-anchoring transpeptidase ErfK/SrfK